MADGNNQTTQLQLPDKSSWSPPLARYVLVGLLVIVVLAGVRAARPAVAGNGPWHQHALPLAGGFEFVLAVLLLALRLVTRRRPQPGYPAVLLRGGLRRAIGLGMLTVAVLAGLSRLNPHPGRAPRPVQLPAAPRLVTPRVVRGPAGAQHSPDLAYVSYALLALLLLAAIVACVLVLVRRLPASSGGDVLALPDDDTSIHSVIESGRRALRSFDDAQAAIIACYAAMEASLAGAGTTRAAAETPDELLGRAVRSGLLQGAAAGRLTALFYEARYSSHPLPAAARDEAVRALDAISAELARRDEDGLAASPGVQGATP